MAGPSVGPLGRGLGTPKTRRHSFHVAVSKQKLPVSEILRPAAKSGPVSHTPPRGRLLSGRWTALLAISGTGDIQARALGASTHCPHA